MKRFKRIFVDAVLEPALSRRMLESWLRTWARVVVRLRKPYIISVTGSVGKSTTTALIASMLSHTAAKSRVGLVASTVGNMNDDVGVPATLLRFSYGFELPYPYFARLWVLLRVPVQALRVILGRYPRVLVLECATDGRGSFARTVAIAPPDIGIVTTIGAAHLESLGSLAGVAQEKGELVRATRPRGLVILGDGHNYVANLQQMAQAPVVTVHGRGIELASEIARATARQLGIPGEAVDAACRDFKIPEGRLNRLDLPDMTIIDDTYNANPLSMMLGLDTLATVASNARRRLAVLGVMAELGEDAARYHEEIGSYARSRVNVLIGVGALAKGYNPDYWFETSDACSDRIGALIETGDCVLVKGSASARMGRVVKRLCEISGRQL